MWPFVNPADVQFTETNCKNSEMEPKTVKRFTFYQTGKSLLTLKTSQQAEGHREIGTRQIRNEVFGWAGRRRRRRPSKRVVVGMTNGRQVRTMLTRAGAKLGAHTRHDFCRSAIQLSYASTIVWRECIGVRGWMYVNATRWREIVSLMKHFLLTVFADVKKYFTAFFTTVIKKTVKRNGEGVEGTVRFSIAP